MRDALIRSVATFVFATAGVLIGVPLLEADVELWKLAAGTGLGSLLNLAYRVSEGWLQDHPLRRRGDGGQSQMGLLVFAILILIIILLATGRL